MLIWLDITFNWLNNTRMEIFMILDTSKDPHKTPNYPHPPASLFVNNSSKTHVIQITSCTHDGVGWCWYAIHDFSRSGLIHYDDVIMTMLASQITSLTVVYSIVYSGVHQRKHQSSASLAFVREIHRGPVNFPHKWPVTRKMFPFDDVIMN